MVMIALCKTMFNYNSSIHAHIHTCIYTYYSTVLYNYSYLIIHKDM